MAHLFESASLDHIDQKTKDIINGYINEIKETLNTPLLFVPNEINILTLYYVDDHFLMDRGSYQWKIKSAQRIQSILNAQPNYFLYSDVFKMSIN